MTNYFMMNQTNSKSKQNVIGQSKTAQFLQSREWGEFQKFLGRKVWFLKSENSKVLVIKNNLGLGKSYLYSPRVDYNDGLLDEIKKLANSENAIFWRVDPIVNLENLKLKKAKEVQPSNTLILDLTKNEEELLSDMHQKTRYNIRLAERKGVKARKVEFNQENFEIFWKLLETTSTRSQIRTHPKSYYKKMLEVLSPSGMAQLVFAEYEDQVLTANLVMHYKDTVTYLHGGSSNEYRNLMAPHLLQWYTIKEAKSKGFKYYDFWGFSESKWPGVTRFKKGFGGEEVNYPGTFDFVLNKFWYSIYRVVKVFR